MNHLLYIIVGVLAGILGGMFGIGGGTVLIPVMVYLFGLTQHQAQGTSLAIMVPPIGLLAALRYWQAGNVRISMAGFICIGFFIGALLGADWIHNVSDPMLKKLFGIYLLFISLRMILSR